MSSEESRENHRLIDAMRCDAPLDRRYAVDRLLHQGRRNDLFMRQEGMDETARMVVLEVPHRLSNESAGTMDRNGPVAKPEVLDLVENDAMPWESVPLNTLAATGQLSAFIHEGFWQPMDTLREKTHLESLWAGGRAPWKIW